MSKLRLVVLALAATAPVLLQAARAGAQSVPSPFRYVEEKQSAGVFAGYVFTDRGDLDLGPHSAPLFGASYSIRLAGPVSGEALLAMSPSRRTIYRAATEEEEGPLTEVGETNALLATAGAGLKLHITGPRTWRGIAPYTLAGLGFVTDLASAPEEEDEIGTTQRFEFGPSFAVSLGAGTDWFPSERLAVRIEARDMLWRLTTPSGLATQGQERSSWVHNFAVTLGAALYF
jgi:opacity protein-like surface antigen